jgi:hypothetical protein
VHVSFNIRVGQQLLCLLSMVAIRPKLDRAERLWTPRRVIRRRQPYETAAFHRSPSLDARVTLGRTNRRFSRECEGPAPLRH